MFAGAEVINAESTSGIFAIKRVFSTATKITRSSLETTYTIDMGEAFVSDTLISKLVEPFGVAAANAPADKDTDKAAKVTKISLSIDTDSRNMSRIYFNTIGEQRSARMRGAV